MALEDRVERLADNVDKLVSTLSRAPDTKSTTSSGGGGFGSAWISNLAGAGNVAADSLVKFSQGTYKATDAVNLMAQASGAFGPVAGYAGQLTGKLGTAAIAVNDYGNSIGSSGMRLSNNLGLLERATLGARMSLPELDSTIKNSGKSISGLSYGMDKSGLVFLDTAKKVQESGLAYQLQATGMSSEEFGKILTLVAHNAKAGDLTRESTQKLVVASAIKLATEFDNTARLTGISIEEQRKALEAQVKRRDVELAMMAMSEEQREALNQNLATTRRYGQSVQDATRIMALGGPVNEEEQRVVASLSPEMQDAVRKMAEVQGTGPEADKRRAAIQQEMDNIVLRQTADKANLTQMQYLYRAGDEQGKAIAASTLEQARYAQILQKADVEAQKLNMTREQYIQAELQRVGAERKATTTGEVAPESRVGVGLNQIDRLAKDTAAGLGVGFEKLNSQVGKTATEFTTLNNILRPFTQEQAAKIPSNLMQGIREKTGVTTTAIPESARRAAKVPETPAATAVPESAKKIPTLPEMPVATPPATPATSETKTEKVVSPEPVKRQDGSFGAVGKFIEDFGKGTPAILHGKEGVVTEKQFNNLFGAFNRQSNVMPAVESKIGNLMNGLQSNLSFELEKSKASAPKAPDMSNMITEVMQSIPAPSVDTGASAMSDVKDHLAQLNTLMSQMLSHTASMADNTEQQVRATKSLSGNMLA